MKRVDLNNDRPHIIISGGGTGGHIFPAISIANEVKNRWPNAEILFVGAENRMEMERVPKAGYNIVGLPVMGFDRKNLLKNFVVLKKLFTSVRKAKKIICDFHPDIAVGVGGYASGPTLKAAQKRGIPTLLQEQNSYAGVTNKMLAKKADAICVAYDGMEKFFPTDKIVKTGNPVRAKLFESNLKKEEAKKLLGFNPEKPLILVIGGSLGSKTINDAVLASVGLFEKNGISVLWQTGRSYEDMYKEKVSGAKDIKALAFIDDMGVAYSAADLVVSRAGASTISELQLLGLPSILIPSPNVAEDHQTKNAMALIVNSAAVMIKDVDAVKDLGQTAVSLINEEGRLKEMAHNISQMGLPDSTKLIVDKIATLINR